MMEELWTDVYSSAELSQKLGHMGNIKKFYLITTLSIAFLTTF